EFSMTTFAIGVDLGGTNLRIAAIDDKGKTLDKITTSTEVARGRDQVIDEMCAAIQEIVAKLSGTGELAGIGIGVPGIIEMQTGMLRQSPNLPGWENYPVRDEIERRLKTTVVLENDANSAALGEKWLGAGTEVDDMIMLTLGTGVGGGIVLNGKIWHGMTGMAGEPGHINVEPNGHPCNCGSRGCLEQIASATAVKRMAAEAVASGKAPHMAEAMKSSPEFGAKLIYDLAMQGDTQAQAIFRIVGNALGVVLADLVNIFNIPMYVIGGGVASAWSAFAPTMMETLRRNSFVYRATAPAEDTTAANAKGAARVSIITPALLGSDAGLIGAARLPMMARQMTLAR
ncbi:MAG TPA: ROK family protein, partial [Candidatus Angelobacter sp.]|nr:ROK family protein [Candidatus Angelobacter sp.]